MSMRERRRMLLATLGGFPAEPTGYTLIKKYTASATFTAPEDGWFQIELFGASGAGGRSFMVNPSVVTGGGGGGGAYVCSRVKLNKGDTVVIASLAVGSTAKVTINSSIETYSVMQAKSGTGGANATSSTAGKGGNGGTALNGNWKNANGSSGEKGATVKSDTTNPNWTTSGGAGGSPGYSGGRYGGTGGGGKRSSDNTVVEVTSPGSGYSGFVKVYRGNTNKVQS